ncbi:hypothetical protein BASA81_010160 [Batrachochytrium salamandrivorans]|nr:hypothetical protein BASA81_010160 [Batrachochytrium salamandrivorans]
MGRKLCQQHKKTSLLIDLNSSLVDLLSIPSLMDTCARSGAVEEAWSCVGCQHTAHSTKRLLSSTPPTWCGDYSQGVGRSGAKSDSTSQAIACPNCMGRLT